MVGQQELDLAEPVALPPAEPDEERDRAGRRREAGRLRVEADERRVRPAACPGSDASAIAIDRQDDGRRLDADDRPARVEDQLAVEGGRQPLRRARSSRGDALAIGSAGRRAARSSPPTRSAAR